MRMSRALRRDSPSRRPSTRRNTLAFSGRDPESTKELSFVSVTIVQPLRVGIGGPVGSGKTALTLSLCLVLRDRLQIAVVTNDIYTEEDAQFLVRNEALPPERILGVE